MFRYIAAEILFLFGTLLIGTVEMSEMVTVCRIVMRTHYDIDETYHKTPISLSEYIGLKCYSSTKYNGISTKLLQLQ